MILFSYKEGSFWCTFTWGYWPVAIRVRNTVFDFILLKLRYWPIRKVRPLPPNFVPMKYYEGRTVDEIDIEQLTKELRAFFKNKNG